MRKSYFLPLCLVLLLSACHRPIPAPHVEPTAPPAPTAPHPDQGASNDQVSPGGSPLQGHPGDNVAPSGQSQALAPGNQTTAQLPPIPPVAGEDKLQSACKSWLASPSQARRMAAREVLATAAQLFADDETARRLFMYKYLVRYLVQQELAQKSTPPELTFFTQPNGQWKAFNPEWQFEPFEEATYRSLYGTTDPTVYPNATWSTQVLLAIRSRDLPVMLELHKKAGFGDAPQWPLEVYRQLFTYGTTRRGQTQWDNISSVLAGHPTQGICWVEMGYGTGMIFPTLRRELGPKSTIIGTEIDEECARFVSCLEKTGYAGWGHIELRPSALNDCLLPANSVDIIHPGLVHIGDGPEEIWQRDWLPILATMKKALKPGGLIIIDNGGSPTIDVVRRLMERAGFVEVAYTEEHGSSGDGSHRSGPKMYYASYRSK